MNVPDGLPTRSEYKPGTVAVATVRGVENVRVMRAMREWWLSATTVGGHQSHCDESVTDIRPQVLLDLDDYSGEQAVNYLRNLARESRDFAGNSGRVGKLALLIADQIEAQTNPKRIPEPGLWGVVVADWDSRSDRGIPRAEWIHVMGGQWQSAISAVRAPWVDLIDPVLVRKGVDDE